VFHILACCLTFIRYIHYIAVSALQQAYETQKAIPHENHLSYGFALLMGWLRKPTKPKKHPSRKPSFVWLRLTHGLAPQAYETQKAIPIRKRSEWLFEVSMVFYA